VLAAAAAARLRRGRHQKSTSGRAADVAYMGGIAAQVLHRTDGGPPVCRDQLGLSVAVPGADIFRLAAEGRQVDRLARHELAAGTTTRMDDVGCRR